VAGQDLGRKGVCAGMDGFIPIIVGAQKNEVD
jgi:hypothetical protein